jgi:hypothetical protein
VAHDDERLGSSTSVASVLGSGNAAEQIAQANGLPGRRRDHASEA